MACCARRTRFTARDALIERMRDGFAADIVQLSNEIDAEPAARSAWRAPSAKFSTTAPARTAHALAVDAPRAQQATRLSRATYEMMNGLYGHHFNGRRCSPGPQLGLRLDACRASRAHAQRSHQRAARALLDPSPEGKPFASFRSPPGRRKKCSSCCRSAAQIPGPRRDRALRSRQEGAVVFVRAPAAGSRARSGRARSRSCTCTTRSNACCGAPRCSIHRAVRHGFRADSSTICSESPGLALPRALPVGRPAGHACTSATWYPDSHALGHGVSS